MTTTTTPASAQGSAGDLFQSHSGPIELAYERELTAGRNQKDLFNDLGFVIRGRTKEGEDVYLWTFAYSQRGEESIIDADLTQTLFIHGVFTARDKQRMHATPYINQGQNIDDYLSPGSLVVKEAGDEVTWKLAGREYTARPPQWHIGGEHAGVRCDLTIKQRGPAFFHTGLFENLGAEGIAGYIGHNTASGIIEAGGRTFDIEGYAVHERIIQSGVVPPRITYMGGRGLNWLHGYGPGFSWYAMSGDVNNMATGMVTIGDEQYACHSADDVLVEEIAHWLDPVSKQVNPYQWRVRLRTSGGDLDARVNAYGRGFYPWTRRSGILVVNQYMADATATFTRTDGTVLHDDQLAHQELMRTFYQQP